jgi:hypothetical protein
MPIILSYVTDLLLVTASLGAAAYCMVLSRRLSRLGSFDKGIGSAIAVLSAQVEEMKAALGEAKAGSDGAGRQLQDLVRQAQDISAELEMMIAACHDFAETAIQVQNDGLDRIPGDDPEVTADSALVASGRTLDVRVSPPDSADVNTGDENTGDDDPAATVPVFGSRRHAAKDTGSSDEVPMFRHRAGAGV